MVSLLSIINNGGNMTSKERSYLKSIASTLEPVMQIGKSNLTPEITAAVEEAFRNRELIKINVLKNATEHAGDMANMMAERLGAEVVQVIGRKIVLYRYNKDNKEIKHLL